MLGLLLQLLAQLLLLMLLLLLVGLLSLVLAQAPSTSTGDLNGKGGPFKTLTSRLAFRFSTAGCQEANGDV